MEESLVLSYIVLHNFGPFKGTHKISNIEDKEIIGVLGGYESSSIRSNRSGKSFFVEAIKYNITGVSRAKKETELIHSGEDEMFVECGFMGDTGKTYVIKRGRDLKNNGILELDWVTKNADAKRAIFSLLGVSKEDFETTSYFKQGEIEGFMKMKPSEQTEQLTKWLNNDHWGEKAELVKVDVKTYKERLKEANYARKALEESLETVESLEVRIGRLDNDKYEITKKLDSNLKELKSFELELSALVEKKAEVNEKKKTLISDIRNAEKLDNIITNLERELGSAKRLETQIKSDMSGVPVCAQDDKVSLAVELNNIERDRRDVESNIAAIKNSKGVCPVLGTKCSLISPENTMNDLKDALENNKLRKVLAEASMVKVKSYLKLKDNMSDCLNEIKTVDKQLEKLGAVPDIDSMRITLAALDKGVLLDDIIAVRKDIAEVSSENVEFNNKINKAVQEIGSYEHRIKTSEESTDKIIKLGEKSDKLRAVLDDLNYILLMYSKSGIASDELDNSFSIIQDKVNLIFKLSGLDLAMFFYPDKELTAKEPFCICGYKFVKGARSNTCGDCGAKRENKRKNEVHIKMLENGIERNFYMDSGGGKTLISFAVRLAIIIIKREQGLMPLNCVFLDEVDAPFDKYHVNKLIDIITKAMTNQLGFEQVFMISHNEEIKDSISDIIKVVRYSDDSSSVSFL